MQQPSKSPKSIDYAQLERQRKAMRNRLYRMIDALEGRPVDRRKYQPFPIGVLEKTIEVALQGLENMVRSLLIRLEEKVLTHRTWDKKK